MTHDQELGPPADSGDLAPGQERRHGRHRLERAVRVPELVAGLIEHAAVVPPHQPAVSPGVDVREVDQIRVQTPLLADRVDRRLEGTETPAERHLLLVGEPLVPEDEHLILLERVEYPPERHLVERPCEIDALDAGAQARVDGSDRDPTHRLSHAPSPVRAPAPPGSSGGSAGATHPGGGSEGAVEAPPDSLAERFPQPAREDLDRAARAAGKLQLPLALGLEPPIAEPPGPGLY